VHSLEIICKKAVSVINFAKERIFHNKLSVFDANSSESYTSSYEKPFD
jgi:hypothetical protein